MAQKSWQATLRISLEWGATVACIISLFQASGTMPKFNVIALVVLGATAGSIAVFEHGWHRAPYSIGTPVRSICILAIIWGGMGTIGYVVWPADAPIGQLIVNWGVNQEIAYAVIDAKQLKKYEHSERIFLAVRADDNTDYLQDINIQKSSTFTITNYDTTIKMDLGQPLLKHAFETGKGFLKLEFYVGMIPTSVDISTIKRLSDVSQCGGQLFLGRSVSSLPIDKNP